MMGKNGKIIKNTDHPDYDYLIGKSGEIMPPLHIYGFDDISGLVSIQLSKDNDILNRVNVKISDIEIETTEEKNDPK